MHKEHDLPAVIIRPFNTYGPNVTQPYIIPEIATQLLSGSSKIKLGNITSKRDLTFVTDTAKGIISALTANNVEGETINLGSNNAISIEGLVRLMADISEKDIEIIHDKERERPFDVQVLDCNNAKAEKLLDWHPNITLRNGLEITIQWLKENKVKFKAPFKGWSRTYRNERNQRLIVR